MELDPSAAPVHDDFDDAIEITSLPFTHSVNTSEATTAADDPDCFGQGPTVWYAFTPSEDGFIEANTFGSDYDTSLSAYIGSRGALTQIACNDDAEGVQSRIVIEVLAGEPVFFMVGAFASGPGGELVFNVDVGAPPPPPLEVALTLDPVGSVDTKTGIAVIRGTFSCSRSAFVDVFGILRDRIGRVRVEAFFGNFFECDGTGEWEVSVVAENAYLVGGPVEVEVDAFFFDPQTDAVAFEHQAGTVRLRSSTGGSVASATGEGAAAVVSGSDSAFGALERGEAQLLPSPYGSLYDVMRADTRVKPQREPTG